MQPKSNLVTSKQCCYYFTENQLNNGEGKSGTILLKLFCVTPRGGAIAQCPSHLNTLLTVTWYVVCLCGVDDQRTTKYAQNGIKLQSGVRWTRFGQCLVSSVKFPFIHNRISSCSVSKMRKNYVCPQEFRSLRKDNVLRFRKFSVSVHTFK